MSLNRTLHRFAPVLLIVAAELYKRGYSVALTLGNAKVIDLCVERRLRTANISSPGNKASEECRLADAHSKIFAKVVYVFVCLNQTETTTSYFIGTAIAGGRELGNIRSPAARLAAS